jgi:soluble lytic murein transglycosylase
VATVTPAGCAQSFVFTDSPASLAVTRGALVWLLATAMAVLGAAEVFAAPRHKPVSAQLDKATGADRHKPVPAHGRKAAKTPRHEHGATPKRSAAARQSERRRAAQTAVPNIPLPRPRPAVAALPPDLAAAKQAIELVRQGKPSEATTLARSIGDPVAQTLVEWALLRHAESTAGFTRYAAFIRANPEWPGIQRLRRRAEARLWQERRDATIVRRFIGATPTSGVGRLARARALFAEGDRAGAEREARAAWQSAPLSADLEAAALDAFGDVLARSDHRARMDRRIGAKDFDAAMRAAKRLGHADVAIVKACTAAMANSAKGKALLDAVPSEARGDLGYVLCRVHWLMRNDDVAGAAKLVLAAAPEDMPRQDADEWWRKRRLLARKLIGFGEPDKAYRIVREAAPPANPYYRAEFHFMTGWIALRFLGDPVTALEHFAHVDESSADPIVRARAAYWRGRATEAAGRFEEMRAHYEAAARHPTAYYGQLALARLGLDQVALRPPPQVLNGVGPDLVKAAQMILAMGERGLFLAFATDLAEESSDAAVVAAVAQLTARDNDARTMLTIGKTALTRGLPVDLYAFPDFGVPAYSPIAPPLDRSVVYSIVRTESGFDQRDMSPANAVGLMQVTPEAARDTAKRFGVKYDWTRLASDPVYNTQMGAAELAALLKEYRGSYIMAFAGYNAGRGRVKQWVAQHGDPRDPGVDAVDWVERIPFSETRNYVQRVMENLQVYRTRFNADIATLEPNLHRAATVDSRAAQAAAAAQSVLD